MSGERYTRPYRGAGIYTIAIDCKLQNSHGAKNRGDELVPAIDESFRLSKLFALHGLWRCEANLASLFLMSKWKAWGLAVIVLFCVQEAQLYDLLGIFLAILTLTWRTKYMYQAWMKKNNLHSHFSCCHEEWALPKNMTWRQNKKGTKYLFSRSPRPNFYDRPEIKENRHCPTLFCSTRTSRHTQVDQQL